MVLTFVSSFKCSTLLVGIKLLVPQDRIIHQTEMKYAVLNEFFICDQWSHNHAVNALSFFLKIIHNSVVRKLIEHWAIVAPVPRSKTWQDGSPATPIWQ